MLKGIKNTRELFDIVDKEDKIIEVGLKEDEIHINDDIIRVVTIYVFDNKGKFYIAQRSPNKIVDPSKYEAPAHGKVNSGESYNSAIKRETLEELGVSLINYTEIAHFYYSFDTNMGLRQHYKKLFIGYIDDNVQFDINEIYNIKKFDKIQDFFSFYDLNTDLFSNAIKYDIMHLRNYFSIKKNKENSKFFV